MKFVSAVSLFLLAVVPSPALSQADTDLLPRCGGIYDLCGYVDRETGSEVIPKVFERGMRFSEGVAAVRIGGRYGYIGKSGGIVIEPSFDLAGEFYQGLAEVVVDGKAGVINRRGEIVVEPQFARAIPFTDKVVLVQTGRREKYRYDPDGGGLDGLEFFGRRNTPLGLFHIEDGWLQKPRFFLSVFETEGRGLIWASESPRNSGPYGLLRADGTWQVAPIFSHVQRLRDGLAVIRMPSGPDTHADGSSSVYPSGAVDSEGTLVIPATFEWLGYWDGGYGLARQGGKEGLVDKQGNLVGRRYYDAVERPHDGGLPRVQIDGTWFGVSPEGTLVEVSQQTALDRAKAKGRRVEGPPVRGNLECAEGARIYEDHGNWGIRDPSGEVIVEAKYRAIDCFRHGVAWVPVEAKRQWCPVGPDGLLREKPDCIDRYYPVLVSHHRPERLNDDPFKSNVLWMRAFLSYGVDPSHGPPRLVGDGVMGHGTIEVKCRWVGRCE